MSLPVSLEDLIQLVEGESPNMPMEQLPAAVDLAENLEKLGDQLVGHFVDQSRRAGCSWSEIGDGLGVSKQAAQKRFVDKASATHARAATGTFARFTDEGKRLAVGAQEQARRARHRQVGSEHIVLALVDNEVGIAPDAIAAAGSTPARVKAKAMAALGPAEEPVGNHLPFGPDAKKILDLALREAIRLGDSYIGPEHVLLGMLRDEESAGARILTEEGITRKATEAWIVSRPART